MMLKTKDGAIFFIEENLGPCKCQVQDKETGQFCLDESLYVYLTDDELNKYDSNYSDVSGIFEDLEKRIMNTNVGLNICEKHFKWLIKNE